MLLRLVSKKILALSWCPISHGSPSHFSSTPWTFHNTRWLAKQFPPQRLKLLRRGMYQRIWEETSSTALLSQIIQYNIYYIAFLQDLHSGTELRHKPMAVNGEENTFLMTNVYQNEIWVLKFKSLHFFVFLNVIILNTQHWLMNSETNCCNVIMWH